MVTENSQTTQLKDCDRRYWMTRNGRGVFRNAKRCGKAWKRGDQERTSWTKDPCLHPVWREKAELQVQESLYR